MRTATRILSLCLLANALVAGAAASGSIEDIVVNIPPTSTPVELPPVAHPETCGFRACHQTTTVGPVASPYVYQCDPTGTACVEVQPVTVLGQQTLPAICSVASAVCIPAGTVLPASGATVATEASSVGVYGVGNTHSPGPIPITVGPVEVTLCQAPGSCPIPDVPVFRSSGAVLVYVHVGSAVLVDERVPITVEAEEVLP